MKRISRLLPAAVTGLLLAGWMGAAPGLSAAPRLSIAPPLTNRWAQLRLSGATNVAWTLEASGDLLSWRSIATLHALEFVPFWTNPTDLHFQDAGAPDLLQRFYRASTAPLTTTDDWRNQVYFPRDPFAAAGPPEGESVRWIKFAILTNEPVRIYFQDSQKYPFHYDFATARLDPLKQVSREEFDRVALRTNGQRVVLGAVLLPPLSALDPFSSGRSRIPEFGIQFIGRDPYPREQVDGWIELLQSSVARPAEVRAIYMPAFEQTPLARVHRDFFLARGIEVDTPARWLPGDIVYATGWTLGRLKYFRVDQIDAAYADGRLVPEDILLTDAVPAAIPVVAGIITLGPSTPNSHVAILARSYGIPFVYLARPEDRDRVLGLTGKEIVLQAELGSSGVAVQAFAVDPGLDAALRAELVALKAMPPLVFPTKAQYGAIADSVDDLSPLDIRYFGGKAAHFGLLRRSIPTNSPSGIAFSFDLWDAFMDQVLWPGRTLRDEIRDRLSRHRYPPDVPALTADLAAIRQMITRTASFSPAQQQAILAALVGFDSGRNIRFRSSSNVEDGETFTGAGLYDSYSGCLEDDLDGDSGGPSQCDPTEDEERGVFRAMQKVYASLYNDQAVIERLRRGVDEDQVGMALLVHHSFPDEIEMANGVATYHQTGGVRAVEMVTQAGAVSVTNPDSSAQPEVMDQGMVLRQGSGLVQLGATVMSWPSDYSALLGLLDSVAGSYQQVYPNRTNFLLDFEYKKAQPGVLQVKQVRPLPLPSTNQTIAPFLLNDPVEYRVFQGETFDGAFPFHVAKTRLTLGTRNMRLQETNLAAGFYADGRFEYVDGGELRVVNGPLSSWPNAHYTASVTAQARILTNRWSVGDGLARRDYELVTVLSFSPTSVQAPVRGLRGLVYDLTLRVGFASPPQGSLTPFTNAVVRLWAGSMEPRNGLRQARTLSAGHLQIETVFYWLDLPDQIMKTYGLQRWEETRITGLTTEPIVLRGDYSQTYGPTHHNWGEFFIFEPRLEPGLPPEQLRALEAANVRLIHVITDYLGESVRMYVLGLDGQVRWID